MSKKENIRSVIVKAYLTEYPTHTHRGLARMIYNENNIVFKDEDDARSLVRYFKGSAGKAKLAHTPDDFLPPTKLAEKYDLPASYETVFEPYKIKAKKMLILSDIHIPYHSVEALELAFDWARNEAKRSKQPWDAILLNGDILDCYQLSSFDRDPRKRRFKHELEDGKKFLSELNRVFKGARIYWKEGNHEDRYSRFLVNKAPEVIDLKEFRLEKLLEMDKHNCVFIKDKRIITFDKLNIIHGHEYKAGMGGGGVNPARGLFLRGKGNAVCGHYHQTSDHTESTIDGKIISCWSIGCMSELNPHYMPLNRWNHGFGHVEMMGEGKFHYENHKIVNGSVY